MFNINEDDVARTPEIEAEMAAALGRPGVGIAALCGRLETELAQMTAEEETEFRESLDAGEPGLDRMVRLSYDLLGLISFLTTGEDETRAWTIRKGTPAVEAAGAVHSDIQRGFIRAGGCQLRRPSCARGASRRPASRPCCAPRASSTPSGTATW